MYVKIIYRLFCLLPFTGWSKDYRVRLEVKNLPADSQPILLRFYNGALFALDTLPVRSQDTLSFKIPEATSPGTLRTILGFPPYAQFSGKGPIFLDFLFNREDIEISLDYQNPQATAQVIHSTENQIYFDFLKSETIYNHKLGLVGQVVINYPDKDKFYQKALEYYKKFQLERDKLIDKNYREHPNTLAGKLIKNQKLPIIPGNLSQQERDSLFKYRYLSLIDFSDTLLLYTPFYTDKIFQYIQLHKKPYASPRENETNYIQALDYLIPLLNVNPIVQQNLLQFLISGFESQQMEEVLAHISNHYIQQCGSNSDIVKRRLEGYSKMAIGQQVPDFTLMDIHNHPVNLYSEISPYTLLLFWHTQCSHCQSLMEALPQLCQKEIFTHQQIKLIGISIDENREDWEKFSIQYPLEWVNIHAAGSFDSEIANDYNLFATPSMFLIDENHKIIAKPTTIGELEKNIGELE